MPNSASAFDLCLAFPQWQGSGRHTHLPRGAAAAAQICTRYAARTLQVPLVDSAPEVLHGIRHWDALFTQFRSAQDLLRQSGARRVLTAGGDCAVDIAVIDYLHGVHPDLSVLWIDAHLDGNTPATSPSASLHGMPVSALFGRAAAPMQALLGAPLDPARFRYFGIHVGDEGDWALQRALGLQTFDPERETLHGPVHLHFDLDVLDPVEFPHLAYTDGDLKIDAAVALVERVARTAEVVGLTLTEFAPVDDNAARDGSRVIARLCEAACRR